MLTSIDKTLAALAVGFVVYLATHYGLKLDQTTQEALTTLLTALFVYIVPNK